MLIIATIPVGISGLLLEHSVRILFAQPAAAIFLTAVELFSYGRPWPWPRAPAKQLVRSRSPQPITPRKLPGMNGKR